MCWTERQENGRNHNGRQAMDDRQRIERLAESSTENGAGNDKDRRSSDRAENSRTVQSIKRPAETPPNPRNIVQRLDCGPQKRTKSTFFNHKSCVVLLWRKWHKQRPNFRPKSHVENSAFWLNKRTARATELRTGISNRKSSNWRLQ